MMARMQTILLTEGVIPTGAVFQAEGGISRESKVGLRARSLVPLVKARAFGMMQCARKHFAKGRPSSVSSYRPRL